MNFEEKKAEYAELIVKAGVHVRKGQTVYLSCPVECYGFGRLVAEYAYREGAKEVITDYSDDTLRRLKLLNAPMSVFEQYPEWQALKLNTFAKTDVAFIHLIGSDPEALKGVDGKKLTAQTIASHEALKDYYKLQSSMGFKWSIAAVPTKAWAQKVFPEVQGDVAVTMLWDAIFGTVRVGEGDAYERWMKHAENLNRKSAKLNEYRFKTLHYENSLGTDFTVGLVKNHKWEGGSDRDSVDGARFFANMPTEEVFTMPDNRVAEGKLVSAMPLSYRGSLIDKFELTFHEGKVVAYKAEKGEEVLKQLLETDEGSVRLGECALVPNPCPVSEKGILFLETLFDENAACHFALGACYETNVEGGVDMTEEELRAIGGNTSANHVDFMVGTKDLKITGTTWDGREITVFENGTWAEENFRVEPTIKGVFFDLDGTVLNTLPDLINIANTTMRELGFPERTDDEIRMAVGNGMPKLLSRSLPEGVEVTPEIYATMKGNYLKLQNKYTAEYEGTTEMLRGLRELGLKTAIITNKPDDAAKEVSKQFFGDLMDIAIGVREGAKVKPDPGTCFEAMEALGLKPEEVIYVGDSDTDIETAKNAGIPCLSATWGFRGAAFLKEHGATVLVDTPADVLKFVSEKGGFK